MPLYRNAAELDFALEDLPRVPLPDRVLLADPEAFDVQAALNPHMREADGSLKRVDRARAREQWEALRAAFARSGLTVDVLPAHPEQTDLVFCANQSLPVPPWVAGPPARFVPSRMASTERAPEVPYVARFLTQLGCREEPLSGPSERLEGTGDGLWHPGRRLLWAGVGPRSDEAAWEELAERYDLPVVLVRPVDPDFYHLDTCLGLLDETRALWFPAAFDEPSRELIRALVPRPIEAPEDEARTLLACNACCPDGREVLLTAGAKQTRARLEEAGFSVRELETSEFLKSGGSVFCMKLLHGPLTDAS